MANTGLLEKIIGYHAFIESEFTQGKGKCDTCGQLPDAPIHGPYMEPIERIAVALERIADMLDSITIATDDRGNRALVIRS